MTKGSTPCPTHASPAAARIYGSITETIGDTPIVRLDKLAQETASRHIFWPSSNSSIRSHRSRPHRRGDDREPEAQGKISPGRTTLIEPTSGNTGIALAFAAAAKGYRLILTMPETMSIERRKMLALLGAELVLNEGPKGMKGAIAKAEELAATTPDAVIPQQFENLANPEIHRKTTAEEIWNDTDGSVDFLVSGIGTGGTITGGRPGAEGEKILHQGHRRRAGRIAGPVGWRTGSAQDSRDRAGFAPAILDTKIYDEIITVNSATAIEPPAMSPVSKAYRSAFPRAPHWLRRSRSASARKTKARPSSSSSRPLQSAISRPPCSKVLGG